MTASPSGQPNAATPNPEQQQQQQQPQYIRRPRAADPLRPRKKPVKRPPPARNTPNLPATEARPLYPVNGLAPQRGTLAQQSQPQTRGANSGWTNPPEGDFIDFPLLTSKKALREGLRYHVARFAGKKDIDPRNKAEFTRPVVLHRRDPQQPSGRGAKENGMDIESPVDSKETEKQEIARAEREKQRAIDLAQIAPTGNNPAAAKKIIPGRNEKTTQVYHLDKTEEQKRASDLRYEEALPWHLEDADNKNLWVGNYEAALSDINVALVFQGGVCKMIPLEKWYKFTSKGQFKAYTIDEAEARMGKKVKESRWVMKSNEQKEADRASQEGRRAMAKLYTVKSESSTFRNSGKREIEDMDELDFNGDDLFQDDDELPTMEPDKDEETKEAQERIKKEQLGANVFDQANEAEVDQEFLEEQKEAEVRKKFGKDVKKALKKRERNYIYDSDSDHPYSETSEDDTSDEEKVKEIDRRLEEENKNKAKNDPKSTLGTNTKGTNTTGVKPKQVDTSKKSNVRKRPGSPNLSESSGNESSRKKPKKAHNTQTSQSSTPTPGARQPQQNSGQFNRNSSTFKLNVNQARNYDGKTGAANPSPTSEGGMTGGEMSEETKRRKLRIPGSNAASAASSRQGSPAISTPLLPKLGPITMNDIVSALPAAGISIGNLMKSFGGRVGDDPLTQTKKAEFIKLVRENAKYGPDKLLRPK
ncbi:hypothetical protein K3495_g3749 [Podosphaera aphanis]|nr:hypothetical protein K3495_g3749 [Podosphaera aphanis]